MILSCMKWLSDRNIVYDTVKTWDVNLSIWISDETSPLVQHMQPEWKGELSNFLDAINPICKEEWTGKGVLGKIYLVVKVCIYKHVS